MTKLAGAVLTDLAVRDGAVVIVGTLAAVADGRMNQKSTRLAGERLGAAALEQADSGRRKSYWTHLDAPAV